MNETLSACLERVKEDLHDIDEAFPGTEIPVNGLEVLAEMNRQMVRFVEENPSATCHALEEYHRSLWDDVWRGRVGEVEVVWRPGNIYGFRAI